MATEFPGLNVITRSKQRETTSCLPLLNLGILVPHWLCESGSPNHSPADPIRHKPGSHNHYFNRDDNKRVMTTLTSSKKSGLVVKLGAWVLPKEDLGSVKKRQERWCLL